MRWSRALWTELVPPSERDVVVTVTPVGERLVVARHAAGAFRLTVLEPDGTPAGEISLPGDGMVWQGPGRADVIAAGGGQCTFVFSSLTQSPATYWYDVDSAELETLIRPRTALADIAVHHRQARGRDGTPIPYTVLVRKDVDSHSPRPTVVGAYGALNNPWPPNYLLTLPAAWVHLGGVYVHAHPRGGGEFGRPWWHTARLATKQTTFDDVHAIAEDLIGDGWTASDRLGIFGMSAGSLPALVAATQRSDLFRAVVAILPLADLLRCRKDQTTMASIIRSDFGNPDRPADAATMVRYSPYHRVEDSVRYPAVLLDCAALDPVCPPWHGRKMAARLQAATSSAHPVLLRVRDCGHNIQMTPAQARDRETEELTFFTTELGLATPG